MVLTGHCLRQGQVVDIVISDWRDQKYSYSAREIAAYINAQAFVAFYDDARIDHDDEMHPLDWAVSSQDATQEAPPAHSGD